MKRKNQHLKRLSMLAVAGAIGMSAFSANAAEAAGTAKAAPKVSSESDVLLDMFLSKGLIAKEDVDKAREEIAKRTAKKEEGPKIKMNPAIKSVELFGDARLRYEWREAQSTVSDSMSRERFRYRLRFGAKGEFLDKFYWGMRLETSDSPRSTNLTMGDDAGPWGKASDKINMGQLYLGYKPSDWFAVEAGRVANPLYTTPMVWDTDINPEGLVEKFKHSSGKFDLFANFGQYLYDEVTPENPFGAGAMQHDAFMFAWQLGAKYNFSDKVNAQIAPIVYHYYGTGRYSGPYNPSASVPANIYSKAVNQNGANDLLVFEVPGELNFSMSGIPVILFGDFAINLDAEDRATRAGFAAFDDQNKAYQVGIAFGKLAKKKSWEIRTSWQHSELFSLDPNLIDIDPADGVLNFEGLLTTAAYAITDNVSVNLAFGFGDRINKGLPTGAGNDMNSAGGPTSMGDYRLLQADLNWKF